MKFLYKFLFCEHKHSIFFDIPRNRITKVWGNHVFVKHFQTVLQNGSAIFHSHQQWMTIPIASYPHLHFVKLVYNFSLSSQNLSYCGFIFFTNTYIHVHIMPLGTFPPFCLAYLSSYSSHWSCYTGLPIFFHLSKKFRSNITSSSWRMFTDHPHPN